MSLDSTTALTRLLTLLQQGTPGALLGFDGSGAPAIVTSESGDTIQTPAGSAAAPPVAIGEVQSGLYLAGNNNVAATIAGALVFDWNATRLKLASAFKLLWGTDVYAYRSTTKTLTLDSDGAGTALTLVNVKGPLTASGNASATVAPSSPTGTTSTTLVMAGLAGSITTATGKIVLTMAGYLTDNTANDGTKAQLSYGTGTAPVNGAALTGTQVGAIVQYSAATLAAAASAPYAATWIVTGLTAGTTYWFDTAFAAITGGTASLVQASMAAFDIP